ncbi:hypothetical protein OSB04_001732 [Centaurea solstitialis]|uniref:Uncharacterized protein n=1 Tax=Centaurea solstitialis TaxID=347529 RepID=A0AA38U242_9ASTR|nr:hypothetical protein OSB04_001732 [Centaurea solstitialis]
MCLRGTNGCLKEENHELKGELRIAKRSWRTRVGDRTRYYGATASEYFSLAHGKVHHFVERLRVIIKRYVEVTVPKTFLQALKRPR